MDSQDVLNEAASIARTARRNTEQTEIEATVQDFERSNLQVYRSLARAYRMFHP